MSGEWSGGVANRAWRRKGHRGAPVRVDAERGKRLFALLAQVPFWCETCGGLHPLAEHKQCRSDSTGRDPGEGRQ